MQNEGVRRKRRECVQKRVREFRSDRRAGDLAVCSRVLLCVQDIKEQRGEERDRRFRSFYACHGHRFCR